MNQEPKANEEFTEEEEFFAESGKSEQDNGQTKKNRSKKKQRVIACVAAGAIALCSFLGGWLVNYFTWDKEMRSLARLKNRIQQSYFEEVTDEEFYGVLFSAVNERILDDYSWYMTEEEYAQTRAQAKGEQSGLGLVFVTGAEGVEEMRVIRVSANSPAERAGIVAGEYIVGYGMSETVEKIENKVQAGESYFEHFAGFIDGVKTGERMYLQVRGIDGNERVLPIAKEKYVENYVFYRTKEKSYGFDSESKAVARGDALAPLPDNAAYIRLTQFNGKAAEQFDSAMELFVSEDKQTLVLDLRGNGGGYLDIMLEIASYFCKNSDKRKPLAAVADYGEKKEKFYATGNCYDDYFTDNSKIFVLADNQTASASECLLGVMLDYGTIEYKNICIAQRGDEVKTYGKGIMQTTYPLTGIYGDAVKLTTARILWPISENCIHARGILPADGALQAAENPDFETETKNALSVLFG